MDLSGVRSGIKWVKGYPFVFCSCKSTIQDTLSKTHTQKTKGHLDYTKSISHYRGIDRSWSITTLKRQGNTLNPFTPLSFLGKESETWEKTKTLSFFKKSSFLLW